MPTGYPVAVYVQCYRIALHDWMFSALHAAHLFTAFSRGREVSYQMHGAPKAVVLLTTLTLSQAFSSTAGYFPSVSTSEHTGFRKNCLCARMSGRGVLGIHTMDGVVQWADSMAKQAFSGITKEFPHKVRLLVSSASQSSPATLFVASSGSGGAGRPYFPDYCSSLCPYAARWIKAG